MHGHRLRRIMLNFSWIPDGSLENRSRGYREPAGASHNLDDPDQSVWKVHKLVAWCRSQTGLNRRSMNKMLAIVCRLQFYLASPSGLADAWLERPTLVELDDKWRRRRTWRRQLWSNNALLLLVSDGRNRNISAESSYYKVTKIVKSYFSCCWYTNTSVVWPLYGTTLTHCNVADVIVLPPENTITSNLEMYILLILYATAFNSVSANWWKRCFCNFI